MSNAIIKDKLVFLIGFGIGFTSALLIYLVQYPILESPVNNDNFLILWKEKKTEINYGKHIYEDFNQLESSKSSYYRLWLATLSKHAPPSNISLESEYLFDKVRVTCVVFVEKLKFAKATAETWGKRCNKLHFFSKDLEDPLLPVIKFKMTKLTSSWQLLCESMNYLWSLEESNETDNTHNLAWTIFIKDDTIVIPENLRYIVAPLNPEDDFYLGHPVTLWGQMYNLAEAGYVLSRSAFRRIIQKFNNSDKCANGGKFWKKEDFYLGKHLSSMGIHPSDTRDKYLRGTFHGYSLQILFWGVSKPSQYWTRAVYPPGIECCSSRTVTFNAVDASKLYTLYYILYHINVFTKPASYGDKHVSTLMSDDEVWKTVIKEEFDIEDINEISNEQYYEMWRSKYSEPEKFLAEFYKSSNSLHSYPVLE